MELIDENIPNFFRNKVVLITGGTGFLGKVLIETILRSTEVKVIYVLARPKDGLNVEERFKKIFNDVLFEKLRSLRPMFEKSLKYINGDCIKPQLGISYGDRLELIKNVNVVVHCAATVRFNEPLSTALQINVQGTIEILNLAKEMANLKSFVHVSTAFVNCVELYAEERFYNDTLPIKSDQLLNIKASLGNVILDDFSTKLIGKYPNTYSFTKAITEEAVHRYGSSLPLFILRPGIVYPIYDEPTPGWIDNMQGGVAAMFCSSKGVLRMMKGSSLTPAPLVPVDFCINMIMAAAWQTAVKHREISPKLPTIYNLVPEETNTIQWGTVWKYVKMNLRHCPFSSMLWYPMFLYIKNIYFYHFLAFIYQTVPAYLTDGLLWLLGKKTRMVKINRKMLLLADVLHYFISHDFVFDNSNTKKLWQAMSPEDRKTYNFDMSTLNWQDYMSMVVMGLRKYLAKETSETLPKAKKLWIRFFLLHCTIHCLMIVGLLWVLGHPWN
ncbi:fatty acyl-CoA reductase wat-like [Stomoxys calcitrans]|uniref:fatty acyl-CoA reductase wat-like n=1 Tax=Stomoxys calcitrans TaxID=35570 RepID=UPI0027E2A50B|nr:fatty acyl-CoA reductase wat-like [Stomoxys calcitrans]